MQFSEVIDQEIGLLVPRVSTTRFWRVVLRGVEAGGLWVEDQSFINAMLGSLNLASAPKTAMLFVSFGEISLAIASTRGISLNETAFGG